MTRAARGDLVINYKKSYPKVPKRLIKRLAEAKLDKAELERKLQQAQELLTQLARSPREDALSKQAREQIEAGNLGEGGRAASRIVAST